MVGFKEFDAAKWARALSWIVLRRKLLFQVADASEVQSVMTPLGAFLLLAIVAAAACLSVTFCAQALGLQMIASGDAISNTASGGLADLAHAMLVALTSVKELHPNAWATALLLPVGVVLASAAALAWLTRLAGASRGSKTPRYQAWWLGMTGYLCLLVIVATIIGMFYAAVDWLFPNLRIFPLVNVASFYLVVVLTLGLAVAQAWRRAHGLKQQTATWELVAIVPILMVLLAELYILPKWAEHHQPAIYARSLSCDLATGACTAALTLSNSGVLELAPEARIGLDLVASGRSLSHHETANLRVKWLSEPHMEGIPIQLQAGELHYARFRIEGFATGDSCPQKTMLSSNGGPLLMSARFIIPAMILGSEGRSRTIPPIESDVEKTVDGTWGALAGAVCLAA